MGIFSHLLAVTIPNVPLTLSPCGLAVSLPCGSNGAVGMSAFTLTQIVPAMETGFLAIALAYFFYYGIRLMIESEEDSTISETKSAYSYAIGGCVLVSVSGLIAQAVSPSTATHIIESTPVITAFDSIVLFIRLMVSAAVSAGIVYQGFRIILLQGDEGEISQQKKRFFNGLIGVAVVTLGNIIVTGFLPSSSPTVLTVQIVGICNYLLEIFGALCVLVFLAAGFMLVVSAEESLKDRAKKAMFTATISLIVVLCCVVIVNFVFAL